MWFFQVSVTLQFWKLGYFARYIRWEIEFFPFFFWPHNPGWVLASSTILLHSILPPQNRHHNLILIPSRYRTIFASVFFCVFLQLVFSLLFSSWFFRSLSFLNGAVILASDFCLQPDSMSFFLNRLIQFEVDLYPPEFIPRITRACKFFS